MRVSWSINQKQVAFDEKEKIFYTLTALESFLHLFSFSADDPFIINAMFGSLKNLNFVGAMWRKISFFSRLQTSLDLAHLHTQVGMVAVHDSRNAFANWNAIIIIIIKGTWNYTNAE